MTVILSVGVEAAPVLAALRAAAGVEPLWTADDFAALLAQPAIHALVVQRDDQPCGYVMFSLAAGEAEIYDVAVSLDCRRAGLGRALMAAASGVLRTSGADCLHLEVAVDNAPAIALYEGFGFAVTGRRRSYYLREGGAAVDALVMTCRL